MHVIRKKDMSTSRTVHASSLTFFDVERACSSTESSLVCPKVLTSLCRGACCTAFESFLVCSLHRNSCPPRHSRLGRPICTPLSLF